MLSRIAAKQQQKDVRSVNANYLDNKEEFFKACEEKRPKEIISLARKLHEALDA